MGAEEAIDLGGGRGTVESSVADAEDEDEEDEEDEDEKVS